MIGDSGCFTPHPSDIAVSLIYMDFCEAAFILYCRTAGLSWSSFAPFFLEYTFLLFFRLFMFLAEAM